MPSLWLDLFGVTGDCAEVSALVAANANEIVLPSSALIGDALRVIALLDTPRTVAEIAEAPGLNWRKVYRILA